MSGKIWTVASGLVLAGLLGSVNPATAQKPLQGNFGRVVTKPTFDKQLVVASPIGQRVANYAAARVNQKGLGDGQCTRLVEAALAAAGARPGSNYVWGTRLSAGAAMKPGDIIQFTSCVLKNGGYTWNMGFPNHTAIVKSATGTRVVLLHQNVDGQPATEKSRVREQTFDLAWKVSGSYVVYRPVAK